MSKKKGIIIGAIIVVLLAIGAILIFNKPKLSEEEIILSKEYKLVKYADMDGKITQVLNFDAMDNYVLFTGYNRFTSKYNFYLYKDGKKIEIDPILNESDVRKIDGIDYYYIYDEKSTLVDYRNEKLSDKSYDMIDDACFNEHIVVAKNDKYGVIDLKENVVIPFKYDYIWCHDSETNEGYYTASLNNKYYLFDKTGKQVFEDSNPIYYDSEYGFIRTTDLNGVMRFYRTNGNLAKEFDPNEYNITYVFTTIGSSNNSYIFYDINNPTIVYRLDKTLHLTKYENVYFYTDPEPLFEIESGDEYYYTIHYINDDIYVTKENDKYILRSISDKKTINEYTEIYYKELESEERINTIDTSTLIACKGTNKCGIVDLKGQEKSEFKYEYDKEKGLLKSGKDYIIIPSTYGTPKKVTCDNESLLENVFSSDEYYFLEDVFIHPERNIYNSKCEKINKHSVYNNYLFDNDIMLLELTNKEVDGRDISEYQIFKKGIEIKYSNSDNAKIYRFVGYKNNKLFFQTDKGLYLLDLN